MASRVQASGGTEPAPDHGDTMQSQETKAAFIRTVNLLQSLKRDEKKMALEMVHHISLYETPSP